MAGKSGVVLRASIAVAIVAMVAWVAAVGIYATRASEWDQHRLISDFEELETVVMSDNEGIIHLVLLEYPDTIVLTATDKFELASPDMQRGILRSIRDAWVRLHGSGSVKIKTANGRIIGTAEKRGDVTLNPPSR